MSGRDRDKDCGNDKDAGFVMAENLRVVFFVRDVHPR